jgi:uncharacterized membrane protein
MGTTTTEAKFDLSKALRFVGVTLLALTALLIWKEVSLSAVYLLLAGSAVTTITSFVLERKKREIVGPVLSFTTLVIGSGWYAATREPIVLGAISAVFATFAGLAWLHRARGSGLHRTLVFQGAAWSGLILSMASDFHLFHASEIGDENFLARRVILTIGWLIPGLALVVNGTKREDRTFQATGLVLTAAALGKLLMYDTVQLEGVLRIASYGLAGVLTLVAGQLLTRKAPQVQA